MYTQLRINQFNALTSGINQFLWTVCRKVNSVQLRHVNIAAKVPHL